MLSNLENDRAVIYRRKLIAGTRKYSYQVWAAGQVIDTVVYSEGLGKWQGGTGSEASRSSNGYMFRNREHYTKLAFQLTNKEPVIEPISDERPLKELPPFREYVNSQFALTPRTINYSVKSLKSREQDGLLDTDVFLPSLGKNLQRDQVWSWEQMGELIVSIFLGRYIPKLCLVAKPHPTIANEDILQVIDGKQRLTTVLMFLDDAFRVEILGEKYHYSELPKRYQDQIRAYHFCCEEVLCSHGGVPPVTDEEKIQWFRFINCTGVSQDAQHLKSLGL